MKSKLVNYIVFVVIILGSNNIYGQWPQWRGVDRDGISPEENLLQEWPATGPKRLWAVNSVGDGFASATVYDKTVYTTGKIDSLEVLTALDLNGNIIWQKEYGRAFKGEWPDGRCTPTFYKNNLYVVSGCGDVACLDSKTGAIIWQMKANDKFGGIGDPTWGVCESPLVADNKMIITPCGKQTTMVALNPSNGEVIWKSESISDTSNYASPVLFQEKDKKVLVTTTRNYTLIIDFQSGNIIWKDKKSYGIVPTGNKNQFYFNGGPNGRLFTLDVDLSGCKQVWCDSTAANFSGGSVILENKIFSTNDNPNIGLYCIDRNTGKILFRNEAVRASSLIAAKGQIYCCDNKNGKIYLFRVNDNNIEQKGYFRMTLGTGPFLAHMSIGNGMLFVRHGKVLVAYDIKQP